VSARIMIDLDRVHPVSGGQWHRVAPLQRPPQPGERITMLCGQVEEAKYVSTTEQTVTVQTWWPCLSLAIRRAGAADPSGSDGHSSADAAASPRRGRP
jgi:hypothetical protein